ncbi:MAG: hypothetical protein IKR59_01370, partial [Lachnospiraceae bacterium]|nr:hypothetical protein [Lachnospiraceae bacterium]
MIVGVFLSSAMLFLPIYMRENSELPSPVIQNIIYSLHHSAQLFSLDADREIINNKIIYFLPKSLKVSYSRLISAEFIL